MHVENIVPIEPNKIICPNLFVYTTKCSLHKFIKKTGDVVISHRACDNSERFG